MTRTGPLKKRQVLQTQSKFLSLVVLSLDCIVHTLSLQGVSSANYPAVFTLYLPLHLSEIGIKYCRRLSPSLSSAKNTWKASRAERIVP